MAIPLVNSRYDIPALLVSRSLSHPSHSYLPHCFSVVQSLAVTIPVMYLLPPTCGRAAIISSHLSSSVMVPITCRLAVRACVLAAAPGCLCLTRPCGASNILDVSQLMQTFNIYHCPMHLNATPLIHRTLQISICTNLSVLSVTVHAQVLAALLNWTYS